MDERTYDVACGQLPEDWTEGQQRVFMRVYRHVLAHQRVFIHPEAESMPHEHWDTVAWNVAWCAVLMADPDSGGLVHLNDQGEVIGQEVDWERVN